MTRPHDRWNSTDIAMDRMKARGSDHHSGAWAHPPRKPRRDWSWVWPVLSMIAAAVLGTALLIFTDQTLRAVAACGPC